MRAFQGVIKNQYILWVEIGAAVIVLGVRV
eukprot:COSAG02_NODE_559_length_20335_cov_10.631894_2_plen_30_part_00